MKFNVHKLKKGVQKKIHVPGDKSISHRAVLLGSIAQGTTSIDGFLMGEDCLSTVNCIRELGIEVNILEPGKLIVKGKGIWGWKEPLNILDAGNSGTTMRLLMGLLAGQPFHAIIKGDSSLSKRPMGRVVIPLKKMGAKIDGRENARRAPLAIRGQKLHPIDYTSPVPSAQVKSAIMLASLFAEGWTSINEPLQSRDHTERMLAAFGADIITNNCQVSIKGYPDLKGQNVFVPGDISSAAFFIVAATVIPDSEIILSNVGVNPTRTGIIDVLKKMGANITFANERLELGEPVTDIIVSSGNLKGVTVEGSDIPRLIDEIPVLTVAAAHAEGRTIIKDAQELRVKETDRIDAIVSEMIKLNVDIEPRDDGMVITGGRKLIGNVVNSQGDHRIGMALAIAGMTSDGDTTIENTECVNISFPNFFEIIKELYN
ncbi:MAG: 3-phosphoshikimate 1-carboxyvinyltransferase [Bacillota bacterium]|jgi:3-phosphoshikimate 1-carboxyvinyltransferase